MKITTPTPAKKDKGVEWYFGAARYWKNEKVANVSLLCGGCGIPEWKKKLE